MLVEFVFDVSGTNLGMTPLFEGIYLKKGLKRGGCEIALPSLSKPPDIHASH